MEKTANKTEHSEIFIVGAILAIVGGFLDAYTYLTRGGVFANAQTGNIACLGIAIASGDIGGIGHYIVPIIAFAMGVLLAQFTRRYFGGNKILHWRQVILIIEIAILFATACMPIGRLNMLVNVLISFVCALQCETFRKVQGNALATTMCTGNLRIAMEMMFGFITEKDISAIKKCSQYLCIIGLFIMGAFLGGVGVDNFSGVATVIPASLLTIAFVFLAIKRAQHKKQSDKKGK